VKTTLASKFGGPAQRWGKASLKRGGALVNHGGEGNMEGRVPHGGATCGARMGERPRLVCSPQTS
jgi:hypothetical protein